MSKRMPLPVRILLLVFVVEFCYMGMELLASRLLSPYFGTTLDVWTSILSVVLAAGAVGNALGAQWSRDGVASPARVSLALGIAGTWFALMPALSILVGVAMGSHASRLGAPVCSLVCFAVPGVCFGCVNPMLADMYGHFGGKGVGESAGTVSAAMTVGGIVGTVVSGFVLVPVLGARDLAYVMSVVLYLLAVVVGARPVMEGRDLRACAVAVALALVGALGVFAGGRLLSDSTDGVDFWRDTEYGHVHVFDTTLYGREARVLNVDGGFESAMFLDEGSEYELVFDYARTFGSVVGDGGGKMVCLGGGAYSIPRAMANRGWDVTCVEIDPGVTEIAREWFGLADTEREHSLACESADGRLWLEGHAGFGADVVLNDTFAGNVPARTLATVEAVQAARDAMAPGGLFVVNVIGRRVSDRASILADEVATIDEVFEHVFVLGDGDGDDGFDNYLVIGTDDGTWAPPDEARALEVSGRDVRALTDDWCPVEWLCAQDR